MLARAKLALKYAARRLIESFYGLRSPFAKTTSKRLVASPLNRSRNWPYAETYADARAISPFPSRPVR